MTVLLAIRTFARFDGETVRRVALVGVHVIVAAPERHDSRGRSFEGARIFELLRDDQCVGIGEAESLEKRYVRDIEHFSLRGIVRPGVTGWAQINQGYAHETDEMRSKLEYDLFYLKHCSLWLDLVIVLRTFAVVLRGTGAR